MKTFHTSPLLHCCCGVVLHRKHPVIDCVYNAHTALPFFFCCSLIDTLIEAKTTAMHIWLFHFCFFVLGAVSFPFRSRAVHLIHVVCTYTSTSTQVCYSSAKTQNFDNTTKRHTKHGESALSSRLWILQNSSTCVAFLRHTGIPGSRDVHIVA